MRTVLAMAVAVALAAGTLSVASGADDKKLTPQQEKIKSCNAGRSGGGSLWTDVASSAP